MDTLFEMLPSAVGADASNPGLQQLLSTLVVWFVFYLLFELSMVVAQWFARRSAIELDDAVVAAARPPLRVSLLFVALLDVVRQWLGAPQSPLYVPAQLLEAVGRIGVLLSILWLVHRVAHRVLFRLAARMAQRTETRFDDLVLPILQKLVRPLIVIIGAILVMDALQLPVQSIALITAGASFVLAFALKDMLSDIYSGFALLLDTPFSFGDVVELADGEYYEVLSMGLRVTRMYDASNHTIVIMPNRNLTGDKLVNLSRPSPDMRVNVRVRVADDSDTMLVEQRLNEAALANPWVLGSIAKKLPALHRRANRLVWLGHISAATKTLRETVRLRAEAEVNALVDQMATDLVRWAGQIHQYEQDQLDAEDQRRIEAMLDQLEAGLDAIRGALTVWLMGIRLSYVEGIDLDLSPEAEAELRREVLALPGRRPVLDDAMLERVDGVVAEQLQSVRQRLADYAEHIAAWTAAAVSGAPEGRGIVLVGRTHNLFQALETQEERFRQAGFGAGLAGADRHGITDLDDAEEYVDQYRVWSLKMQALTRRVQELRNEYQAGMQRQLDEQMIELRRWLSSHFKETAPHWKEPSAKLVDLTDGLTFELKAYVDNTKLSHFTRASSVRKQLLLTVHRLLRLVQPTVQLANQEMVVELKTPEPPPDPSPDAAD